MNATLKQFFSLSEDYDFRTLRRFIGIFPNLPLTNLLQGYFNYMQLPARLEDTDVDELSEALPESTDSFSSVLVRNNILFFFPYISHI